MKTLFVTDLDGTLMRDDKIISQKTTAILNRLITQGVYFTYATARSFTSASHITKNIDLQLPVIIRNGTVLVDPRTREEIEVALFMEKELVEIRQILMNIRIPGFATTYLEGREQKVYLADRMNEGFHAYLQAHADDSRLRMTDREEELYMGKVCYFTFIAEKDELEPLYERVKRNPSFNCIFQQDKYWTEYWLELCPLNATKAKAVQRVKELCGCERVVVFGDSVNDISMFHIADEAYAVKNAIRELKETATGIIGDNNADGVAEWLEANAQGKN